MNLVYGPFVSRRYGTTIGINLLGSEKVCSYNCIYCGLGATNLTMNKVRKDYVFPTLDSIRDAFREYIKQSVPMEAIVVSGNGEPTLHPDFDNAMKLICDLRAEHLPNVKIVVLTNGAHLDNKKVIAGLNLADERVVKVDAGNDSTMQKLNAPLIRINLSRFLAGIGKLKDLLVQAMFVTGEFDNTTNEVIEEWIEVIGMIKPAGVQIYTISRPTPVMPGLKAVAEDDLYAIAFKLKKRTNLESAVYVGPAGS